MELPGPPQAMVALAAFVRERLGEVAGSVTSTLAPTLSRNIATAVVGAAAPFAPTSYSRARLVRQMYASGLLTDEQARATRAALCAHDQGAGSDTAVDAEPAAGTDGSAAPR